MESMNERKQFEMEQDYKEKIDLDRKQTGNDGKKEDGAKKHVDVRLQSSRPELMARYWECDVVLKLWVSRCLRPK
jgi:hypothetical protein